MDRANFSLDVDATASALTVSLYGELDLATTPDVEAAVAERWSDRQELVLDLRGLTFMDSTGVRLLLELQRRGEESGVAFIPPSGHAERILDLTGIRAVLNWVDVPA